ncbi:hypothetical protein GCM10023194_53140 [Planotetraspora phitsanulokensis]|uniref:Uncharacterized protein n=1 Tax=Planotetraspora phitsanulokensis TaxID=575192 RepID=A0A8J3XI19_9ACTN|nr:hypothetical protein [Planotetraspora phitsanulokensis]GII42652.1 hypothetical protein Pph01_76550 [Planotetraspora phitsanulokensis]
MSRPPFVPDSGSEYTQSARSLTVCDTGLAGWGARNLRVLVVTSQRRAGAEHSGPESMMNSELPEDHQRRTLRERLEVIQVRTEKASSWRDAAEPLRSLINREGYVPISARLAGEDLEFLSEARDELLNFVELGIRLLDLHQPRDAGGITSDATNPILRCRSCMWRWPCPTFRAMAEAFSFREPAGRGPGRESPAGTEPEAGKEFRVEASPEGDSA